MSDLTIKLSNQDLADYLEGNEDYMAAYTAEMQKQLTAAGFTVNVEAVLSSLKDEVICNCDNGHGDRCEHTDAYEQVADRMTNNWDWLPK